MTPYISWIQHVTSESLYLDAILFQTSLKFLNTITQFTQIETVTTIGRREGES